MKESPVFIGDTLFTLYITETQEERTRGLMHINYLPPLYGMLFVFNHTDIVNMWMRNTRIPLDILFCDEVGKIVHIEKNTTPYSLESISSRYKVRYTIEINGGTCDTYSIHVGQRFMFPFF